MLFMIRPDFIRTIMVSVFFCFVYTNFVYGESGLTGEEILSRMNKAKESFYSYKQTVRRDDKGITLNSHSFAQSRPEGDILWTERTRVSDSNPGNPQKSISLSLGYDKQYDYSPDVNIAVDLSYVLTNFKKNMEKVEKEMDGAMVTFEPVDTITYDNTECYEIKSISTKEGRTLAEEHYIIDKNTYLPRLHEGTILGQAFKAEYQDVRPEPEMTIDFFNLPEDVIVKKVNNNAEWTSVLLEMASIRNPPPK